MAYLVVRLKLETLSLGRVGLADPNLAVGQERVGWDVEIQGRRALPDAPRRIVLRAVAGTEPAVIVALMRQRDAAEMGADADHHQPLVVAGLDALLVGLRIAQRADVDGARLVHLFLRAVVDEDRLAAPEHLDDLPGGDRREVDVDRRAG